MRKVFRDFTVKEEILKVLPMKRPMNNKQKLEIIAFFTLFIIQHPKEHNTLETESVSVLTCGGGRHLLSWIHRKS
jgi:hypothetical protein